MPDNHWSVYLLRCAGGSRYCGATNDLPRRLAAHDAGKGSKYTRSRLPVKLVASRSGLTKSDALSLEAAVKCRPRSQKIKFLRASQ